jgi:DNA-binding GntR family transcriptional regulator
VQALLSAGDTLSVVAKFEKLQKEPLTRRAVQAIRAAIFAGEFTAGQRLVEEDLAASLGVSRNVIREALWQLEAQGLLQSDDYKGKSVAKVSVSDMSEMIPLRLSLESLAATWAARNITPEAAAMLRAQADQFLRLAPDFSRYPELDFELHQTIWKVAGNRQLALMLDRIACPMIALQARIYESLFSELTQKEIEARSGSHQRIVEAICAGDAAAARSEMQQHILAFWEMWLREATASQASVPNALDIIQDALSMVTALSGIIDQASGQAIDVRSQKVV